MQPLDIVENSKSERAVSCRRPAESMTRLAFLVEGNHSLNLLDHDRRSLLIVACFSGECAAFLWSDDRSQLPLSSSGVNERKTVAVALREENSSLPFISQRYTRVGRMFYMWDTTLATAPESTAMTRLSICNHRHAPYSILVIYASQLKIGTAPCRACTILRQVFQSSCGGVGREDFSVEMQVPVESGRISRPTADCTWNRLGKYPHVPYWSFELSEHVSITCWEH